MEPRCISRAELILMLRTSASVCQNQLLDPTRKVRLSLLKDAGPGAFRCLRIECPPVFSQVRLFAGKPHPYYLKQNLRNQVIYNYAEWFSWAGLSG